VLTGESCCVTVADSKYPSGLFFARTERGAAD